MSAHGALIGRQGLVEATSIPGGERLPLERSPLARLPDRALKYGLTVLAALILVLIVYFFFRLVGEAAPAFERKDPRLHVRQGLERRRRTVRGASAGDRNADHLGDRPAHRGARRGRRSDLRDGAVPAPPARRADDARRPAGRGAVGCLRLWGIFFLAPHLQGAEQWVADRLSFIPFIGGGLVTIPNYFVTGLVLAIMILPIVAAISREVMTTVPSDHKEAALALGATRWEMIRIAVLPYCRSGIVGGAMLGLGRAIGETIAVTILIGDAPQLSHHLFEQGYSLAAAIANEFGEAQGLHRSALFAAGLVLFVLTLLVNGIARGLVIRAARATNTGTPTGGSSEANELADVAAGA